MYIKQSMELLYAAHVVIKNNLNSLLIQVAPDLMKGKDKDYDKDK